MRLIDADKIDFRKIFVGASAFAQDLVNGAQSLIDNQPTAYDADKVVECIDNEVAGITNLQLLKIEKIVKEGGVNGS